MAAASAITNPVLRAHQIPINGCRALDPSLDEASAVLEQAHAVLILANTASEEQWSNPEIIRSAMYAAESLLADGIRKLAVGHEDMLTRITRQ